MANIREAINNPPMFIPWGGTGSAINIARAVGSRLSIPTLQGLANWARSNAAREATMNAIKQTPRLVAEDIVIDGIGNATTPITERYGDSVGFLKTAAKRRPLATIVDGGLTLANIPWQDRFNNVKNFATTVAEAANLTPEEIDLSTQNIPSARRTNIRLNESLFDTPKVYGKDILYTTPLNPIEQKGFQAWLKTLPDYQRNGLDYDLQGYYKSARNGTDSRAVLAIGPSGAHLNDVRKTPFHPTFSNQSMYHGVNGWQGGNWTALNPEETQWTFNVGSTNRMPIGGFRRGGLLGYFANNEKGNIPLDTRQSIIQPTPFIYIRGH